jgi:hypothetical protein
VGNFIILSIVFLYPRFSFVVRHWGAFEREILLSEGSKDNPNTDSLRKIYKLMYFVKDKSRENGVLYFINPQFSLAHVYKIVLPRKVQFFDSEDLEEFSLTAQRKGDVPRYFVFRVEDTPYFCSDDEVIWDESGWGIYKVR